MATLHLTLHKHWFDMVVSGEKTEEYRELKIYWAQRFMEGLPIVFGADLKNPKWKDFDQVIFRHGYDKDAPRVTKKFKRFRIGTGKPEWGAEPGKRYFVIEFEP